MSVSQEQVMIRRSTFVASLERWIMAVMQANYGKSDDVIVNKIADSCRNLLAANISYHEEVARVAGHDEPVIARQHRLLAHVYRTLTELDER